MNANSHKLKADCNNGELTAIKRVHEIYAMQLLCRTLDIVCKRRDKYASRRLCRTSMSTSCSCFSHMLNKFKKCALKQ